MYNLKNEFLKSLINGSTLSLIPTIRIVIDKDITSEKVVLDGSIVADGERILGNAKILIDNRSTWVKHFVIKDLNVNSIAIETNCPINVIEFSNTQAKFSVIQLNKDLINNSKLYDLEVCCLYGNSDVTLIHGVNKINDLHIEDSSLSIDPLINSDLYVTDLTLHRNIDCNEVTFKGVTDENNIPKVTLHLTNITPVDHNHVSFICFDLVNNPNMTNKFIESFAVVLGEFKTTSEAVSFTSDCRFI